MAGFTSTRISLHHHVQCHLRAHRKVLAQSTAILSLFIVSASKKMGSYHLTNTPKKNRLHEQNTQFVVPENPRLTDDEANPVYEYSHFLKTNSTIRFPLCSFVCYLYTFILFTPFGSFVHFRLNYILDLLTWDEDEAKPNGSARLC